MKLKLSVDAGAYIVSGLFLLLLGPHWMGAALASALVHELGHIALLWVFGVRGYGIHIGAFGARIQTEALYGKTGILCTLAGPAAGGMLLLFFRWLPRTAVCGVVQSLYNLIPVYPLDGGRALRYWREEKAVAKSFTSGYNRLD